MNQFTPTRKVIRLDYFGQPYEAIEVGAIKPNLGQLWSQFVQRWDEDDARRATIGTGVLPIDAEKVDRYEEQQLLKQENKTI